MSLGERLGKRIDGVTDAAYARMQRYTAVTRATYDGIRKDAQALAEAGEARLERVIDTFVGDERLSGLVGTVRQYAAEGAERTREALREKAEAYKKGMDELSRKKPEVAGLIDGFLNTYLDTPTNRRNRSRAYQTHVQYGRVVGVVSSVAFVAGRGYRVLVGAIPLISRGAKYLKKKVTEAQEHVEEQGSKVH